MGWKENKTKYNQNSFKHYRLLINKKRSDLIDHIKKQPNVNGYLIELIKKDMNKGTE